MWWCGCDAQLLVDGVDAGAGFGSSAVSTAVISMLVVSAKSKGGVGDVVCVQMR